MFVLLILNVAQLVSAQDAELLTATFSIPVPGGLLVLARDGDAVVTRSVSSVHELPGAVDIREGDVILSINDIPVASAQEAKDLYQQVVDHSTMRLETRRGRQIQVHSFSKIPDVDQEPRVKKPIIIQSVNGSQGRVIPHTQVRMWSAGILIANRQDSVVVTRLADHDEKPVPLQAIERGDVFLALNGEPINTTDQFIAIYDRIKQGDDITLEMQRNERRFDVLFKKP